MTANVNAMVRAGVEAYRAGNRTEARTLLERAIEHDEQNEQAWMWLSAVVDSTDEQIICLQNVLIINPNNERARQGLQSLGVNPAAESPAPTAQQEYSSTPAFTEDIDDYAVPSSSASVDAGRDVYTSEDYDEWMSNLDLGTSDDTTYMDEIEEEDFLGDLDFSGDVGTDFNDNYYDIIEDEEDEYASDEDVYTDDYAATFSQGGTGYDADLFEDAEDYDDLYDEEDDSIYADGDYDEGEYEPDDLFDNSPADDDDFLRGTIQELTRKIPAEIEATRRPGESESIATSTIAILGVLAILNVGALAFIVLQLAGLGN